MPQVEFEPTILVFRRAKTVHTLLDHTATLIDKSKVVSVLLIKHYAVKAYGGVDV
jgi:hypothetical protein